MRLKHILKHTAADHSPTDTFDLCPKTFSAVVTACGRWYITDGGIYGNRLQNIYLDYKWNCVAFADAGLCSICGYNFGLLELDNFAIDLRGITFLQLETQDKKRYPIQLDTIRFQ